MSSINGTNLNVKNENGRLQFTGSGSLLGSGIKTNLDSSGLFNIQSGGETNLFCLTGNTTISNEEGSIDINGKAASSQAIYIQASSESGGIQLISGSGGTNIESSGDVNMVSTNSNINIGSSTETQSININSLSNISLDTEDITIIASDNLSLISLSGNVQIGSSTDNPIIQFEDGNLLVNQSSSTNDYQLDVAVKDESSDKNGYNGIIVNSSNNAVASDITLKTSNGYGVLSMGTHPLLSNYSHYNEYLAYQTSNAIIRITGPEFEKTDIGRPVYWSTTERRDTIESLGKLVVGNSDTANITVVGTYTGTSSKNYLIQIDSNVGTNTFRWSSDGGQTFQNKFVNITYSTSNIVALDNGLSVAFTSNTGFNLDHQMSFMAKITANVSSTSSISTPELLYTLQPYHSYIGTELDTDLVVKTNNTEKMRITGDGNIVFKKTNADAEFHINSNYNRSLLVNESLSGYQINPSIDSLNCGGYVIVWESEDTDGSGYGVYGQVYAADGSKIGNNFKVNNNTTNQQSNPDVAHREIADSNNYIVVWSDDSASSGNSDIYAQIYKNGSPLQAYDIAISTTFTSYEQVYPRAAGLTNGNYIVVWSADINNDNQNNIYGQIIDNNGNLVGSRISIDTNIRSQNFPSVTALSSSDPTAPGGFVVGYMTELSSDDDRFTINFRVFDYEGTPINTPVLVTEPGDTGNSSISDGLVSVDSLPSGGFIIFFYRNYEADTSLYSDSTNVEGLTSSASGIIYRRDNTRNFIVVISVSGTFLEGEEISIVDGSGTYIEKIKDILVGVGNVVLYLSTDHKEVYAYRFNSDATLVTDAVWGKRINTSLMYEDKDRINLSNLPRTRATSIFNYRRPIASLATSYDNDNVMFVWTNGTIPNLYYQIVSTTNGSFIGQEEQFGTEYRGLKQRNSVIANLKSIQGNDYGFVSAWDNTGSELSQSGVFHQLIGYNHNFIKAEDGYSKLVMDHTGKLGLGTTTPSSTLHIKSNSPKKYNEFNRESSIAIQNTATHILTNEDQQKIKFLDGNGTTLGQIKGSYSLFYDNFGPEGDDLVGYYKFDESEGARVVDSSSASSVNGLIETVGVLKNFDLENCWQPGLINNCLLFDGIDNYVTIHDDAANNLNVIITAQSQATFNFWVNIPTYIKEGDNVVYDILSNVDDSDIDSGLSGLYLISLIEQSNSGNLNLRTKIRDGSTTRTITGSTTVNTGSWVMITVKIDKTGTTMSQYVNTTLDGSTSISSTITQGSGLEEQTTFIGSLDGSSNFFRGKLDELRIYKKGLTTSQITELYNYGNKTRGSLILTAKDDNSYYNNEKSVILDHDGRLSNIKFKPAPYTLLTGTLTYYNSNTTVEGVNTLFTKQLSVGDIIRLNGTNYPIVTIASDTSLTINENPLTPSDPSSQSEQSVVRKAPIYSSIDKDGNLTNYVDESGNNIIGTHRAETKLTVSGTGNSDDLPYLTLVNTTDEDTDSGRETRVIFKGNNGGSYHELVRLEGSHLGIGDDTRGQFKITTNNGTDMDNVAFTIVSNGSVGIGNMDTPPKAQLHCRNNNGEFNLLLEGQSNPTDFTSVFSERSSIYFGGVTSINDDTSSLNSNCLVAIQGSGDSTTKNFDGRLDFLTNNDTRDNGLEKRMTITKTGNVGISVYQPRSTFQVAPEIRNINYDINTIDTYTGQEIELTTNLLTDTEVQSKLVGGTVVIGNAGLTSHEITSVPSASNIVVNGDISSSTNGDQIFLHYPGLNVVSNGCVGIGTSNPKSILHVEGSLGTAIKTVTTSSYTVSVVDHTILMNSTANPSNVYLPVNHNGIKGRIYIIKNIHPTNIVTLNGNGANIDGTNPLSLAKYKYVTVQSDGTNWFIIGEN